MDPMRVYQTEKDNDRNREKEKKINTKQNQIYDSHKNVKFQTRSTQIFSACGTNHTDVEHSQRYVIFVNEKF